VIFRIQVLLEALKILILVFHQIPLLLFEHVYFKLQACRLISYPKLHIPWVSLWHHYGASGVHQAILEPPQGFPIGVESRLEHGLVVPIVEIWLLRKEASSCSFCGGLARKFRGINLDTEGGFLELKDFVFQVIRAVLVGVCILRVNLMGWSCFIEILVEVLNIIRAVTQLLHFESSLKARLNLTHRSVRLGLGQ
jgi:hypothetical protein